jgi:hypothetical protein
VGIITGMGDEIFTKILPVFSKYVSKSDLQKTLSIIPEQKPSTGKVKNPLNNSLGIVPQVRWEPPLLSLREREKTISVPKIRQVYRPTGK